MTYVMIVVKCEYLTTVENCYPLVSFVICYSISIKMFKPAFYYFREDLNYHKINCGVTLILCKILTLTIPNYCKTKI